MLISHIDTHALYFPEKLRLNCPYCMGSLYFYVCAMDWQPSGVLPALCCQIRASRPLTLTRISAFEEHIEYCVQHINYSECVHRSQRRQQLFSKRKSDCTDSPQNMGTASETSSSNDALKAKSWHAPLYSSANMTRLRQVLLYKNTLTHPLMCAIFTVWYKLLWPVNASQTCRSLSLSIIWELIITDLSLLYKSKLFFPVGRSLFFKRPVDICEFAAGK